MQNIGFLQTLQTIMDVVSCILFLVGVVAGILAITRKKVLPGILAIAGFALLGLQLILRLILFRGLAPSGAVDYLTVNWISTCGGGGLFFLAILALVIGFFTIAGRKKAEETPEEPPAE